MRAFLGCFFFVLLIKSNLSLDSPPSAIEIAFSASEIVPDVTLNSPTNFIKVKYANRVQAILGNSLTLDEVANQPSVSYLASSCYLYTLAVVDPDAPSRLAPVISQIKHWLVGNIPGDNVKNGEVLASYLPPTPPPGTGDHRYVFLVFKQKQKIEFDEPKNLQPTTEFRLNFSISEFAQKYQLGDPIAGNFFVSRTPSNTTSSVC